MRRMIFYQSSVLLSLKSMSRLSTLEKAQRAMHSVEHLRPRGYSITPYALPCYPSPLAHLSNNYPLSKHNSSSHLKTKQNQSRSFSCLPKKDRRYDQIMRVKDHHRSSHKNEEDMQCVLDNSLSQSGNGEVQKENQYRNQMNRLDKIMQIKVIKPQVHSTLINYQPKKGSRPQPAPPAESSVKEWKECMVKMKKTRQQKQKEDKLWMESEREREQQLRCKREVEEKMQREERRRERRFQGMVIREIDRIQRDKELSLRKNNSFCNYLYPSY